MPLKLIAVAVLAGGGLATAGCRDGGPDDSTEGPGLQLLFVGNSLTYTNDLPNTVASIGRAAGDRIQVASQVGPGLALIDHLTGSTQAAEAIRRGGWDFVVLQQGPTPAGICRDSLVLWTRMFDQLIREVGAEPAIMMTWPSQYQTGQFDAVRESFRLAAAAVHGTFLPAGEAWRLALASDPSLALYGGDGFHPTALGTFLAALEIYERVTGRDARTLTPVGFAGKAQREWPETVVRLLQRAAHEANARFPAHPDPVDPTRADVATAPSC